MFESSLYYLPLEGARWGVEVYGLSSSTHPITLDQDPFEQALLDHLPTAFFCNAFVSWRVPFGGSWLEFGTRAFNLFFVPFRNSGGFSSPDGRDFGAEQIGRLIMLYVRGGV